LQRLVPGLDIRRRQLEAVGWHVTIGTGAAVAAEPVHFSIQECMKTALDRSALLAAALDVEIG
jgi:hypothetical protein